MSTPPIQYSGPAIAADVPWEVRRHLQLIYQKLGNHTQAFQLFNEKVTAQATATSSASGGVTVVSAGGTGMKNFPQAALLVGNGTSPVASVSPVQPRYVLTDNGPGVQPNFQLAPHAEPLTDGNSNLIFAAGDIVVVTGLTT